MSVWKLTGARDYDLGVLAATTDRTRSSRASTTGGTPIGGTLSRDETA
jgi:hypothetical protein